MFDEEDETISEQIENLRDALNEPDSFIDYEDYKMLEAIMNKANFLFNTNFQGINK